MKVAVAKWGNSIAVRLPRGVSDELGLNPGGQLDLTIERGEIRLRKPRTLSSAELLAAMLAEAKRLGAENEPETVEWGPDVGSEIIDDEYSRGEVTLEDLLKGNKSSARTKAPRQRKQSRAPGRR